MLQRLICFSLWGDHPKYLQGALDNVALAARHFPDWVCRFYCADDLHPGLLQALKDQPNVQLVLREPQPERLGAFWRFAAIEESVQYPDRIQAMLFRDTDSRLSAREAAAVEAWLQSDRSFHLMRDHPFHWTPIMAGMWGCKGGRLVGFDQALADYQSQHPTAHYEGDQAFLAQAIYPHIKVHALIHDSMGLSETGLDVRPFPTGRVGLAFVGQSYEANGQPNAYYEAELAKHLRAH